MSDNPPSSAAHDERPRPGEPRGVLGKVFSFRVFLLVAVSAGGLLVTVWENAPVIAGRVFVEGDTWWHTAVGSAILRNHAWPTKDIYSFTVPGSHWIAYEWLGEVVMAIAARLGGTAGLAVLLSLLAVTIALLTYYFAWLRSGNLTASALAAVVALQLTPSSFTMRPQLIGYIFLLITLIVLERYRQHRARTLWFLPFLFLIWVNTHSSFVLGFVALAAYWAAGLIPFRFGYLQAERWTRGEQKHILWVTLVSLLALFVTPYGLRLAQYPVEVLLRQKATLVLTIEWLPLSFGAPYARFDLFIVLVTLLLFLVSPVVIRLDVLLLLLFTIVESCLHVRFLLFFAIVFAPVFASIVKRWSPADASVRNRPLLYALMIVVLAAGMLTLVPSRARLQQIQAKFYPVGAIHYLRTHSVPSRMFNDDVWGGYLIRAFPGHRVFMDGRFDIYEYGGVLVDYVNFINHRGDPAAFLDKYRLDSVLLRTTGSLGKYFANSLDWRKVFEDSTSVIYVRADRRAASGG